MCGIAGIIDSPDILNITTIIDEFSKFNMYRGPDYYGKKIQLGTNVSEKGEKMFSSVSVE